jgi:predicted Zn-dependent protease
MKGTDPRLCFSHAGRSKELVKAEYAAKVRGEKIRSKYDTSEHGDPLTELLHLSEEIVIWKNVCKQMVGSLTEVRYRTGAGEQLRAEIRLYEASLDRAAKVLSDLVRLGIEDRLVKVRAAQTALVAGAVEAALAELAPLLGYDPSRPEIRVVVAEKLRLIQAEEKVAAP